MHLFGMITTSASRHYTPVALRSFLAHTPLGPADRLVLIDNDGDFELPDDVPAERITVVRPAAPQAFARNANVLLAEARACGADLFLLNNDLVFTPGWLDPLAADRHALISPLSNAQISYTSGRLSMQPAMSLSDYEGHEAELETVALRHRQANRGYRTVSAVAFFCIKIPKRVYEVVGDFDERFGRGGGEDRDYTVRAWLAGIPQELALASFVLHFQGKSTWNGAETDAQVAERANLFTNAFHEKWGPALTYAFLGGDWNLFRSDPVLAGLLEGGQFPSLVEHLHRRRSLDPFIERQRNARFTAVCHVGGQQAALEATLASIYDACESICLLVDEARSEGPAPLPALPDPKHKIQIVRGKWQEPMVRQNDGLRLVAEAGGQYGFLVEAGDVYDAAHLERALDVVRENPQVDCWPASTFGNVRRSLTGRTVTPTDVLFVRPGTGRFVSGGTFKRSPLAA